MNEQNEQYQFVNSETGNVIGYLSVATTLTQEDRQKLLAEKQAELARQNHLYVALIYWQKSV